MVRVHRRLRSYLLNALLIIFNMMSSAGFLLDRLNTSFLTPCGTRAVLYIRSPNCCQITKTQEDFEDSECIWYNSDSLKVVAYNQCAFNCTQEALTHIYMYTHYNTPGRGEAGGNGFLTWYKQPCHLSCCSPPPPRSTYTRAESRTAASRVRISCKTQVHALPLPLANNHLQTPCMASLLHASDL